MGHTQTKAVLAADVAALVTMSAVMEALGVQVRRGRRADCPLCEGRSVGTVSFTDQLWHCHRCRAGGDVFSLALRINGVSFKESLCLVAAIAGVEVADNVQARKQLAEAKQRRTRLVQAVKKLAGMEYSTLICCRNELHTLHSLRRRAGDRLAALRLGNKPQFPGEAELCWDALRLVADSELRAAAAYTLVSFGNAEVRTRFTLRPKERAQMVERVVEAGYVESGRGRIMEVVCG